MMTLWSIAIPLLFALSAAGLAYTIAKALSSGAEVYSGAYSEDTARQFEDVFLFIPPRRIAEIGWTGGAAVFLLVFFIAGRLDSLTGILFGLLLGGVCGTFTMMLPRQILILLRKRRLRRFNMQLIDTLLSLSNSLKAGFSITQAIEAVVREGENPIAQEFSVFLHETRVGVKFSDALDNMERRVGSVDLTLVVRAIDIARRTGGNLTEILEKISATIRERVRIENRIRTLTAQGRLQGIVVGIMPLVIAAVLAVLDPQLVMPFFHSAYGILTALVVAILVACGALMIRKIIHIDI